MFNDSMWSSMQVQVVSWRMLSVCVLSWPQELIDNVFDEDTLAWAQATGEGKKMKIKSFTETATELF
jgi:protein PhnA